MKDLIDMGRIAPAACTEQEEAWARALCIANGSKPDQLIGEPKYPRWRSWVSYAQRSIIAARSLGVL